MPEFFQTLMGKKFYDSDVPRIAKALERIAAALEQQRSPPLLMCASCSSDIKGRPTSFNADSDPLCQDCAESSRDPLLKRVKVLIHSDDPNTTWELADAPEGIVVSCDVSPALTDFPET